MQTESTRPVSSRSVHAPRAGESGDRRALLALQCGAILVVLAAAPYPFFQLDRYTFVKELILLGAALTAVLLCLASARKLTVFMVDGLVAAFLALSLVSAVFAANGWLAARALGVSLAGAALFWGARTVARRSHGLSPGRINPCI